MRSIKIGKDLTIPVPAIVMVCIALLAGLLIVNAGAIHRQLDAWKLLPQPERLTELYFQDHAKLPTTYTPGVAQSFAFTAHNLEYRSTDYQYKVVASSEDGSQSQDIASGSFRLEQDKYLTRQMTATPQDLGRRVKISVTITYTSDKAVTESIHYWVTTTNAKEANAREGA